MRDRLNFDKIDNYLIDEIFSKIEFIVEAGLEISVYKISKSAVSVVSALVIYACLKRRQYDYIIPFSALFIVHIANIIFIELKYPRKTNISPLYRLSGRFPRFLSMIFLIFLIFIQTTGSFLSIFGYKLNDTFGDISLMSISTANLFALYLISTTKIHPDAFQFSKWQLSRLSQNQKQSKPTPA